MVNIFHTSDVETRRPDWFHQAVMGLNHTCSSQILQDIRHLSREPWLAASTKWPKCGITLEKGVLHRWHYWCPKTALISLMHTNMANTFWQHKIIVAQNGLTVLAIQKTALGYSEICKVHQHPCPPSGSGAQLTILSFKSIPPILKLHSHTMLSCWLCDSYISHLLLMPSPAGV